MKKEKQANVARLSDAQLDHYISYMGQEYNENVAADILSRVQEKQGSKGKTSRKKFTSKLVVAFALMFFLVPGTVYAGSRVWDALVTQNGHGTIFSFINDLKNNGKFYRLDFTYLPAGFTEVAHTPGKYQNKASGAAISTSLIKVDDTAKFQDTYVKEVTPTDLGNQKAWIMEKEGQAGNDFKTEAYVTFETPGYVVTIFANTGVTQDVLMKVIKGIKLTEVQQEEASPYIDWDSQEKETTASSVEPAITSPVIPVGESFATYEHDDGGKKISLKESVDDVQVYDTLQDFPYQDDSEFNFQLPDELKKNGLVGEDGNLKPFTASCYKQGDGISTVDELIKQEQLNPRFILLTVTVENTSDEDFKNYYFSPSIYSLTDGKNGGLIQNYQGEKSLPFNGADLVYEPAYIEGHGEGKAYYNIGSLAAGEKRVVKIGYFTTEDEFQNLYFTVNPGNSTQRDSSDFKVVKLFEKE